MVAAWRTGNRSFARTLYNRSLAVAQFPGGVPLGDDQGSAEEARQSSKARTCERPGPRLDRQDSGELGIMLAEIGDLLADLSAHGEGRIPLTNTAGDQEEAR